MQTILVTGGTGQVGLELGRQIWPADTRLLFPAHDELDIGSQASVRAYFGNRAISAVINSAAYTAVDKAETDAEEAFRVNAKGPQWLAEVTRNVGIPLIQVSTDYVFDGSKASPYIENDPTAPLGVYGASKQAGEDATLSGNPRSVVLRTAWLVSAHRSNFLKTMLRVAATAHQIRVVDDQIGCPTAARDAAAALKTIVLRMMSDLGAPSGVFHFVNAGEASWCKLAREIFALSAARGGPAAEVAPITTAEYPTPARRPANSRLITAKIAEQYGIYPRDWRTAVRDIIDELVETTSPEGA